MILAKHKFSEWVKGGEIEDNSSYYRRKYYRRKSRALKRNQNIKKD